MTAALVAGLLAGYGVAVPVGAIAVLVMGLTARTSFRVGAAAALGVATADGVYALAAVLGGAALAGLIEPVATSLRWVSAAVLAGIALRGAWAAVRQHRRPPAGTPAPAGLSTPGRAYAALLGLTLLNPATIVYFAALVLGRQAADSDSGAGGGGFGAGAALFVVGAFVASASWQLLIAGGGVLVGRVLAGPTGRLATALLSAAMILALAVFMVVPR